MYNYMPNVQLSTLLTSKTLYHSKQKPHKTVTAMPRPFLPLVTSTLLCLHEFANSRYFISLESAVIVLLLLASFTLHPVSRFHPRCSRCKCFMPLYGRIISTVRMEHLFFIHSLADGHLGGFYLLSIVNNVAVNIMYKCLCEHSFNSLG